MPEQMGVRNRFDNSGQMTATGTTKKNVNIGQQRYEEELKESDVMEWPENEAININFARDIELQKMPAPTSKQNPLDDFLGDSGSVLIPRIDENMLGLDDINSRGFKRATVKPKIPKLSSKLAPTATTASVTS